MAALKVLVGVMGVLIVAGLAAVAYGVATRLGGAAGGGYGDAKLTLPPGGKVLDMAAAGDRLVLRIALPDASQRLLVVDLAHGRQVGALELVSP